MCVVLFQKGGKIGKRTEEKKKKKKKQTLNQDGVGALEDFFTSLSLDLQLTIL